MKKSLLLLLLISAVSIFFLTGCSRYLGHTNNRIFLPGPNQELIFEDMRWEQTSDSAIATIDLDKIIKNLSSTSIKSITVKKNGFESIAQYLNWGRDNLYKYEIVNDRILLYWQMEDSFYALSQPVTIIVRLK